MDLPIVCTLTQEELQVRRSKILATIRHRATGIDRLPDGYTYRFKADSETLGGLAELVDLERQCCQFLTFKIIVEPQRELRLEITGPRDAPPVIADYFGAEISN